VHKREIDILVGTQMVTKGHDFGGVTLVGVLQAWTRACTCRTSRAAERTFQLLEQVAGRAGRRRSPGPYRWCRPSCPEHPASSFCAITTTRASCADEELGAARKRELSAISRCMIALRLDGRHEARFAPLPWTRRLVPRAQAGTAVLVLGPAEAPIPRLRGRSRYQIWLCGTDGPNWCRGAGRCRNAPAA